jgi:hypothetical protein
MRQALLIIDMQPSFAPPQWLIDGIQALIGTLPNVATVERHDESTPPFQKQLGWHPALGFSVIRSMLPFYLQGCRYEPESTDCCVNPVHHLWLCVLPRPQYWRRSGHQQGWAYCV